MTHSSAPGPTPAKPLPGRRTFMQMMLQWGTVALGVVATLALGIPIVGYLLGALVKRKTHWVPLGRVDEFPVGETRVVDFDNPISQPWDGMVAHTGCFVRNLGKDEHGKDQFRVLAVNCAHLGCPVSWFPQSGLFMCPCHGGVYYEDGSRASGPPPRGLYECVVRVIDGKLDLQAPFLPTLQDTLTGKVADAADRPEERS
jgi:nitrite reductase/ring-hydroxylating ferredoxin subunit